MTTWQVYFRWKNEFPVTVKIKSVFGKKIGCLHWQFSKSVDNFDQGIPNQIASIPTAQIVISQSKGYSRRFWRWKAEHSSGWMTILLTRYNWWNIHSQLTFILVLNSFVSITAFLGHARSNFPYQTDCIFKMILNCFFQCYFINNSKFCSVFVMYLNV